MSPSISTPREALREMLAAGATFRAGPGVGAFGYSVRRGGDAARCHEIFRVVQQKPKQFLGAFRFAVLEIAERADR